MNSTRLAALAATLLMAISTLAAPVSSQEADGIDPAAITAPAAPDPIVMGCQAGQVDVNGTEFDLASLTKSDGDPLSRPIRRRIVEGGPYLQPSDLLGVNGVTGNDIAAWEAAAAVCVTPPMVTVNTPDGPSEVPGYLADVCPADGARIDVNNPDSRDALRDLFGRPTGDRVIDGQPDPPVTSALRIASGSGVCTSPSFTKKILAPVASATICHGTMFE